MEISIRDLLAQQSIPGLREAHIRYQLSEAITSITGVEVTPEKIHHIEGRVVVDVPPVLKSAIRLRRQELTERLQKEDLAITDIC